jgi:4-hydroxy-tetrahydrodipicolinate synthase
MMAAGASGVISVASNVLPKRVSEVTTRALAGDFKGALAAHLALLEFHGLLFVEPNPAPAKALLAHLGRMQQDVRLPLVVASEGTRRKLVQALEQMGTEAS